MECPRCHYAPVLPDETGFTVAGDQQIGMVQEMDALGNPAGSMNNDVYLQLLDAAGNLIDDVEIGDDFEGDGIDGAPFPDENGNASTINDEAIARVPDGADTDDDVADFARQRATLGQPNGRGSLSVALPVLNDLGSDSTLRQAQDRLAGCGQPLCRFGHCRHQTTPG